MGVRTKFVCPSKKLALFKINQAFGEVDRFTKRDNGLSIFRAANGLRASCEALVGFELGIIARQPEGGASWRTPISFVAKRPSDGNHHSCDQRLRVRL